jgi:hypothetical protein
MPFANILWCFIAQSTSEFVDADVYELLINASTLEMAGTPLRLYYTHISLSTPSAILSHDPRCPALNIDYVLTDSNY